MNILINIYKLFISLNKGNIHDKNHIQIHF